jgi:hypothetical protein
MALLHKIWQRQKAYNTINDIELRKLFCIAKVGNDATAATIDN